MQTQKGVKTVSSLTLLDRDGILGLRPEDVTRPLDPDELKHIASELGAFWQYDHEAADEGRVGMHAILKSGLHSDGFFVSKILFEHENILRIIAQQIVYQLSRLSEGVDYVAGVPKGATKLGETVAELIGANPAEMKKADDGSIMLVTDLPPTSTFMLVEDICTRGTAFREAVQVITQKSPGTRICPWNSCIINRGGIERLAVEGVGSFKVMPVAEIRINDWEPEDCPLCKIGSIPIRPKKTDENWELLTSSQRKS